MGERGTIQKIADATGVNQATVRRALVLARLTSGRGGYNFEQAIEVVKANADPARIAGHATTGRGEGGSADSISTLAEAKALSERLRARKLELENARVEGRLVDRKAVIETLTTIIGTARTECLALGVRCAPKLVGATDPKHIARTIEAEMRRILDGLSDDTKFFEQFDKRALL